MSAHDLSKDRPAASSAGPPRRVLRDEVLLVLALSLAASALYALVDLLSAPLRGVEAPLFADVGLVYQLLNIATSLVPVLLALHFLGRSGESAASIGLDTGRPWADLRVGVVLAAGLGTRVGADGNKAYLPLAGRSMVSWSLTAVTQVPGITRTVPVVRRGECALAEDTVQRGLASATVGDGGGRAQSPR